MKFLRSAFSDFVYVFYFCTFRVEDKGADIIINAFNKLKKSKSSFDYKLLIMGDGPEKENLISMVEDYGIDNSVDFLGYLPNYKVNEIIANATLHIVPSRFEEPFGVSATEGMANGALTIVSKKGGLIEYIEDGTNGLTFETDDFDDLANKIEQALNDHGLYRHCIENAYTYAKSHSWMNVAQKTLECYNEMKGQIYISNRIR
jgi:glycosyltransferase involved in cell wall biosynthesis